MSKPVVLLGGGGHARVLMGMLRRLGIPVLGIADPNLPPGSRHLGMPVLGDDSAVQTYSPEQIDLVNGIGSLPGDAGLRAKLFDRFCSLGYGFKTVIDPKAWLADGFGLADGVQVMMGAIVQVGAQIGQNCIINSGAIVEHDCRIGSHVHIAPGTILCGDVEVGDKVHIGAGATVIQGIRIGKGSVVGAGSIVTRDVGDQHIVYPARSQSHEI